MDGMQEEGAMVDVGTEQNASDEVQRLVSLAGPADGFLSTMLRIHDRLFHLCVLE